MNLESLKLELYEKELSLTLMAKITGGQTLTGCNRTNTSSEEIILADCSDMDVEAEEELSYA